MMTTESAKTIILHARITTIAIHSYRHVCVVSALVLFRSQGTVFSYVSLCNTNYKNSKICHSAWLIFCSDKSLLAIPKCLSS